MSNLGKRIERLEAQTTPERPAGCWYWPADELYTVGPEAFTLAEFRARYGGDPADVCATIQAIGALHWRDI